MHKRHIFITTLALALLALALAGGPSLAQGPTQPSPYQGEGRVETSSPLGTTFTYQGRLTDGGAPANGAYDFEFKLYDDPAGTGQVGDTVTKDDVLLSNGLFTAELDFGASAFTGDARYLHVGVRPGSSTGAYTALTPRQPLHPTPYALYSLSTGALQGYAVVPNKPPTNGQVLKWDPAGWIPATDNKSPYVRTVIVSPIGDANANGQALMDALGGITDASASNPYLLKIEPGIYDLGTATLQMKEYVDIEGSGEGITILRAAGCTEAAAGTVRGANNAELRFLTVENTGENNYAIAIYNKGASPRLTHVTAIATGGTIQNIAVQSDHSSPAMTHVTVMAHGGSVTTYNYGMYNDTCFSPIMRHVFVFVGDGVKNYGVYNKDSALMGTEDLIITVAGGANCYGVLNDDSLMFIQGSRISVGEASVSNIGVLNVKSSVGGKVQIDTCKITVSLGSPGYTIYNSDGYDTAVGASHLGGGPVYTCTGACPVTCAGVYDTAYTFYANTCP